MAAPTRLTYFLPSVKYGGAEVGMARLLDELDPDAFDVTVVTLFDTSRGLLDSLPDHVRTILFSAIDPSSFHRGTAVWEAFQRTDVLVCSLVYPTVVGTTLARLHDIPTVITWQHSASYRGRVPAIREFLSCRAHRVADRVFVDSEAVKEMVADTCGVNSDRIAVVPLAALDTDQFAPAGDRVRESGAPFRVATVGRLVPVKGHADVLSCAARLGEGYEFHVIGDGPLRADLETDAPENVIFHGTVDNEAVPSLLARMDAYFQPSRQEGLCISVVEAMATGLPVVASAVGGIPESVTHGENGYLAESGDVAAFCRFIEALAEDDDRCAAYGRRSRQTAVEQYSAAAAASAFVAEIDRTHGEPRTRLART